MEKRCHTQWAHLLGAHTPVSVKALMLEGTPAAEVSQLLSEEECEGIIAATEEAGYGKTAYVQEYRGNLRLICDDASLAAALWTRVEPLMRDVVVQYNGHSWVPVGLNTRFRFAKYPKGTSFEQHVDGFYIDDDTGHRSFYTLNVYLNTAHPKAGTRFYLRGTGMEYYMAPQQGAAILFQQAPIADLLHAGCRVPSGYKYLMRTDVMFVRSP